MEKATSVLAAFDAGKFPDQSQANQAIDWVLVNLIPEIEPSGGGELSAQGKAISNGLREVLKAYKQLGSNKNGDDIVQKALWHLSEGDLESTSVEGIDADQTLSDLRSIRSAARTIIKVAWINVSSEGFALLDDFASFARLALADFAEAIEGQAGKAKEGLRTLDMQVQEGERDHLGRKQKSDEESQRDSDPKVRWESGMDTAKDAGSKIIGLGQDAKASAEETASRTSDRVHEAYIKICDRAQNDKDYHHAMVTVFDIISKWLNNTVDTATQVQQSTTLESFINDPTPEQHVIKAIRLMRTFIERLAGGKSLDDLFSKVGTCVVDVRTDEDLKNWFNDFFTHVRKSLDQAGYARSNEASQAYNDLRRRWGVLKNPDLDAGKKWKKDVTALQWEIRAFEEGLKKDKDLSRVKNAHAKLGEQVQDHAAKSGSVGIQFAMDQATWFWQDLFNVYAPHLLALLKDIPIPRTEYVDPDIEFVLENLDISSFNLLPGHVYIRNITDVDITAPAPSSKAHTKTAIGTLTHIRIQAMQLSLKEVSFWYKDKSATLGPSEFTGLMEFELPSQGVDVDIKIRLLPNTPDGLRQRESRGGYHFIERVEVKVADDIVLRVKESNHAVLLSMFKPIFMIRFRDALAKTLAEQIRWVLETADSVAWDVGKRSEVFSDAGLGSGSSIAAGIWSEIGRFKKMDGKGILSGWNATGTGFVKDDLDGESKLAMGAEPQIIPGEKKGPLGINSQSLAERMPNINLSGAEDSTGAVARQATNIKRETVKHAKSFKQAVETKSAEEKKRDGWKSEAFDLD